MRRLLLTLSLLLPDSSFAQETVHSSNDQTIARLVRLEEAITSASSEFARQLKLAQLSPEERAIRIERWQRDQGPMIEEARTLRAKASQHLAATTFNSTVPPVTNAPSPETGDPLLSEIREIEGEVGVVMRSLEGKNVTAEQRAIQIEQFHQLNRETMHHLESLKRQVALRNAQESAGIAGTANRDSDVSDDFALQRAQLWRIMQDLAKIDPESRAKYLEAHGAALESISEEQARSAHMQSKIDNK